LALNDAAYSIVQFDAATAACLALSNTTETATSELYSVREGGLKALAERVDLGGASSTLVLPRHEATLRILTLPAQDPDEIKSMVSLSASELVPYPIEEMLVTHACLARLPGGESRVLVVLVRQEVIDGHLAEMRDAGLEPTHVFLSTACLIASASEGPDDNAILYVGPSSLELAVFREGELRFSRGIAHSDMWDLESPVGREALAYETRDMLAAFRRESEDGTGADAIQVSAYGLSAPDIVRILSDATGKEFQSAGPETGTDADAESYPATLMGAWRLLRGEGPLILPLAPPDLAQRQKLRSVQSGLGRGLALASAVLLAMVLWFGQAVWQRHVLIEELQRQVEAIAPSVQGIAAKQQGLQIISRQVDRGGSFLELLAGVANSAPPDSINITRIQFERETGMTLWGRAQSKDLILRDFLGGMRENATGNLALLSQAHSLYETAGTERNVAIFNYQIAIPVSEEDGDVDASRLR
jgi:hypothetical protein